MAGKVFPEQYEEAVAIPYREVLDRANSTMQHLTPPPPVIPGAVAPAALPMSEVRRKLLRDGAALTVARHLMVNQLEHLGVPRDHAIQYMGELAMVTLKKVTEAEKTPSIIS